MSDRAQAAIDAGKVAPALAVTFGAELAQMTVEQWAYTLTVVYTALLIGDWIVRKIVKAVAWWRARKAAS